MLSIDGHEGGIVCWGGKAAETRRGFLAHGDSHTRARTHNQSPLAIPSNQSIRARPDVSLIKILKGTREEGFEQALAHVLGALGLKEGEGDGEGKEG